ncbi:hypothetical protein BVC80_737g10 [Macleaya cordata]|uniref:Membrane-associated kinase regulator 2 n=1 Tax=Macleaya cordata TaxID=56857 RepID=A0A200R2K1_MACCD|nr:hypothetical protein BVC80_737g10 [Macleaya cordata]
MEAFSLLKYWRVGGGGGGSGGTTTTDTNIRTTTDTTTTTTTIATTVREMAVETDEECDDEGPFFDLEFAVPDEDAENDDSNSREDEGENDTEGTDGEPEFNFAVSPGSSGGRTDPNLTFSPSDDLFFKGKLVPLEPSSLVFNQSENNSNRPQFPVSLLKTATKFRVFMLGFKKPKSVGTEKVDNNGASGEAKKPQQQQQQQQSKFLTVKLKVEEVPIISLFTRDNSSRIAANKINKQSSDEVVSEEKKFSKDVVQKYLKMIKPLYVRVSKRYGEKLGFSGQLSLGSGKSSGLTAISTTPVTSPTKSEVDEVLEPEGNVKNVKNQKQGNLPTGFRVVRKHLGKSRSASSAVAAVTPVGIQAKRRDDSLLQQQDGIQSAILHCKRSFNASRDTDSCALSRSSSDQSHDQQSIDSTRTSFDEVIEARI